MKEHYKKKKTTKNKEKQKRSNNQRNTGSSEPGHWLQNTTKKESLLKNNKIYAKSVTKSSLKILLEEDMSSEIKIAETNPSLF